MLLLCFVLGYAQIAVSAPVPVTVKPLEQLIEFPPITAPATVISLNDSRLSAEVTAVVVSMPVEVGQVVVPGTPVVYLERTNLELGLKRAEATMQSLQAQYKLAQSKLERAQALARRQSMSEEELHQRETELAVSQAEMAAQQASIEQIQRNLEKTVVRAPFRAIVMDHLIHVGELATHGTPLVRVLDADRIEVSAKLQVHDIASLVDVGTAQFVSGGERYPVKLHTVTPALDVRERSQEVRLRFTGESALIGTTGNLIWRHKAPHLPADLLVRRGEVLGVFVVEQDYAKFIALADAQEGRPSRIDLPGASLIIINGRFLIGDGEQVSVVEAPGD